MTTETEPVSIVTSSVVIPQESHVLPLRADRSTNGDSERSIKEEDVSFNATKRHSLDGSAIDDLAGAKRPRLLENAEMKNRGRRLFNVIRGTLHRTEADNAQKSKMMEKRAETEKRLQEKLAKEKEELSLQLKKEREERHARIQKERQETEAAAKIEVADVMETQLRHLSNFIRTRATPHLYYLPTTHTEETETLLADHKREMALESAQLVRPPPLKTEDAPMGGEEAEEGDPINEKHNRKDDGDDDDEEEDRPRSTDSNGEPAHPASPRHDEVAEYSTPASPTSRADGVPSGGNGDDETTEI